MTEPGSAQYPVPSHGGAMTAHLGLILHVTTNWSDPGPFFRDPSHQASSTWWVRRDGWREQYVNAGLRAWAQAAGNSTYDSVETDGTPDVALTAAQVESVGLIYAWGVGQYGWPLILAEKPGDRGLGWHGMGGAAWGGHYACPGDLRKAQRIDILDAAAVHVKGGTVPHPAQEDAVTPQDKQDIIDGIASVLRVMQHGDPGKTNGGTHPHNLDAIDTKLDLLVKEHS